MSTATSAANAGVGVVDTGASITARTAASPTATAIFEFHYYQPASQMRIVSFLSSATETLYKLGIGSQIVGVTHECKFPLAPRVGDQTAHGID
jgi:ABC-type hemin transport system substrate-binding protein